MAEVALFIVQIVAQTRDIFAIWKIVQNVPISNINLYHKTHLSSISYSIFISHICHNLFGQMKIVSDYVQRLTWI